MVELQTERLILRELTLDDAPALNAVDANPDMARWLGFTASLDDSRGYVESVMRDARESPRQYYTLAIVRKADNGLIGRCGFDRGGPNLVEGSLGYSLHHDHWGQGYMTEAIRALIGFGFAEVKLHRILAEADPRNVGSWRVMEKVGMRREGHLRENFLLDGAWCDSYLYAVLDREWEAPRPE
jgi:[ribosomal protein S5]-alanine N-acetyltransferase